MTASKRIPDGIGVVVHIDLLTELQACLRACPRGTDWDWEERVESALWRVLGSQDFPETCLSHEVWVSFRVKARTWQGAATETERMHARLTRAIARALGCQSST